MLPVLIGITVIVVLVAAAYIYRKSRQRRIARTLDATIVEGRYVPAGGVDQWIQIRGTRRENPILLIVGGSGLTMEPFTTEFREWEQHFTVVFWDRRDVGRTRARNGKAGNETWTFERLAGDGIEIIEFLCGHLGHEKVVLVGQSQGSIVGVTIAQLRPDLLHAYVGTGQIADMAGNEEQTHGLALERARAAGNSKAVKALERYRPPFRDARSWINKQRFSMATDPEAQAFQRKAPAMVLFWPHYGLGDIYRSFLGALFLPPRLFEGTMAATPRTLGTRFEVPILLLHGEDDLHTLPSLAGEYLDAIEAPDKQFVSLPGTGHMSLIAHPGQFLRELLTRLDLERTRPGRAGP